jgi:hypothetical protein
MMNLGVGELLIVLLVALFSLAIPIGTLVVVVFLYKKVKQIEQAQEKRSDQG